METKKTQDIFKQCYATKPNNEYARLKGLSRRRSHKTITDIVPVWWS